MIAQRPSLNSLSFSSCLSRSTVLFQFRRRPQAKTAQRSDKIEHRFKNACPPCSATPTESDERPLIANCAEASWQPATSRPAARPWYASRQIYHSPSCTGARRDVRFSPTNEPGKVAQARDKHPERNSSAEGLSASLRESRLSPPSKFTKNPYRSAPPAECSKPPRET